MTVEAMKSHILHYLHRRKNQPPLELLKSQLLGSGINYDDVFQSLF
jgi:hypothetical protein